MPTIFRKTAKGVAEIDTRAHRLPPRLRSLLILVDGKRDSDDLARLVAQPADASLRALLGEGFIEAVGETLAASVAPAYVPDREPPLDLVSLRKAAVRALAEQLGPSSDALVVRMEKARSLPELQPLLGLAAQLVLAARGRAAADAYAERFPSKQAVS